jgi:hypothetical protein
MITKRLDGIGHCLYSRCGLPSLLLALTAGTAWAGDEPETADPEHVQAVVEEAAAETDKGRTDPKESWFTETPTEESGSGERSREGGDGDLPEHKVETMEKMDDVVDDAAAEADDGRTSPRESWFTESTEGEEPASGD